MDPTFREVLNAAMPDAVITNFIFVAEIVKENGTEMTIAMSDGITPWLAKGMLECAKDLISEGSFSDSGDEDDD